MEPITVNINLNLSDEHVSQICGAIGCLAQIVDLASRTSGTPFPLATQVNMTQHGENSTQIAQVANVSKGRKPEPAAEPQQKPENAAETQHEDAPGDAEPPKPKHTHEDIRNLVINLTQSGQKDAAAEIVHKYATKVSAVPETKLDKLYVELEQLGGIYGTDD